MKLKIQQSRFELTTNSNETAKTRAVFSFSEGFLPNAVLKLANTQINPLDDLSDAGSISLVTSDKTNIVISLGKKDAFNLNKFHKSSKALADYLSKNKKIENLDVILEEEIGQLLGMNENQFTEQSIFHLFNNMYYFDELKSKRKTLSLKQVNFVTKSNAKLALNNAIAMLDGIFLIKDLGNNPANIATPSYLAKTAEDMTKISKKVSCKILDKKEIKQLGMNCFLAVTQGSEEPPKFITLTYSGGKEKQKPIVLVGKGVTFDCGGISIKPSASMNEMKYDMMGAATALGVFMTVAKLGLPINLIIAAPCTENLLSGYAVKPGDIVTTMSGQTVEILNTDAEGRLALCDALTYVEQFNPELVIDMATLTGACIIALGNAASGLYSNDDDLTRALQQAAKRTDDKVWHMPLFDEYDEGMKSSIADMANIGGWAGVGGSAVAAKFLSKFVNYRWAHLDIAGTAHIKGSYDGNHAHGGATGRPFSLLLDFIRNYK